jgi:hypothetical protein
MGSILALIAPSPLNLNWCIHSLIYLQSKTKRGFLSIVDKGYGIPFKQVHKKAFLNNNKSSRENVDFVEAEIRVVFQRLKKYLQY